MNGVPHLNGKNRNLEKTYPGCLGRMVNLFELNVGMSANRRLTDVPHQDGFPVPRSRADSSRMSPSGDPVDGQVITSEFKNSCSNRKSNGTPMKMLIAQEMSKEVVPKRDQPNVVAKLMGLDALPGKEHDSTVQRSICRGHPRSRSDIPMSYWVQQSGFSNYVDPHEGKDVYRTWQQSHKSPSNERNEETKDDKKMALVRQKFIEAKRFSMDEKLRQSKEFQDALEVLSSNKDLFLKCLQEPNSMFSQHLHNPQSVPPQETKRITVLRPSKMADSDNFSGAGSKDGEQMKKGSFVQLNRLDKIHPGSTTPANWKNYENHTQPTRIVVLKPSPGRLQDVKAVGSPQPESPRILHSKSLFGDIEDDENQESREVAKAIAQQMCKKLGRHCRDESLISSVFSNGYVGDESSSNKSEIEYANGNLSDSEITSPVSRHSWDYVNRLGSPYSSSSFSRASYSPDSSVCREAKKRLSERWAMMSSNGSYQEQKHVRRSSSTLGEMLALSEAKREPTPLEESSSSRDCQESNSLFVDEQKRDENLDNSPRNLTRSKSLPLASTTFGNALNMGISVSDKGTQEVPKEHMKSKSAKSLFRGKVSNLFFSRNKKPSKDKSLTSETRVESYFPGEISSDTTDNVGDKGSDHALPGPQESSSKPYLANLIGKQCIISSETGSTVVKTVASGNLGENQDQPSPISVLDPNFEEDDNTAKVPPHSAVPGVHGAPLNFIGSNLIDKSPLIGSITRTLSWAESCVDIASSPPLKGLTTGTDEEEQEWFSLVKTLLSVAGLQGEVQSSSFFARWHSPESPLDPSLRDKCVDLKDKETLHEAKRRQKRSIRKLVFDCVNAAIVDIAGYGSDSAERAIPCMGASNSKSSESASSTMVDEVWARMGQWFSGGVQRDYNDYGEDNSLVVERMVRKEVVGKGWIDHLRLEIDNVGKEIERKMLEELVQESVIELTGRV